MQMQKITDKVKKYMCLRSPRNYYIGLTSQVSHVSISFCIIVVVLWLFVGSPVIASLYVKTMHSNKTGLFGSYFSCIMAPLKILESYFGMWDYLDWRLCELNVRLVFFYPC